MEPNNVDLLHLPPDINSMENIQRYIAKGLNKTYDFYPESQNDLWNKI